MFKETGILKFSPDFIHENLGLKVDLILKPEYDAYRQILKLKVIADFGKHSDPMLAEFPRTQDINLELNMNVLAAEYTNITTLQNGEQNTVSASGYLTQEGD